jgi:rSAM/selenodomain-associated transferase 1
MVDVAHARVVAILTRAPSAGGKSRLFAELGRPYDPHLLEALLLDTIDGVATDGVRCVVAVTPSSACDEVAALTGINVMPQIDGDLGERMRAVMTRLFANGTRAVVLVGSDVPTITPSIVAGAFAVLDREPGTLVLGPATDGGYYLLASAAVPDVFSGIEWGSVRVLSQTLHAASEAGLRVHRLDTLTDVDTVADLRRVESRRTAAWVRANMPGVS